MTSADSFSAALALHHAGRIEEARSAYQGILRGDPNHFDSLSHLGIAALQQGRHEEAVAYFDTALRINPDAVGVYSNRGVAFLSLQRNDEAVASFDQAIARAPDYAEAHNNRGVALVALGRHQDALASFERAIALRPAYAKAFNDRGSVLIGLRRFMEAVSSCDSAIAIHPDYAEAHDNRGIALHALGRCAEAVASFDRAIAISPESTTFRMNRGVALEALKRYGEAAESYERALDYQADLELIRGAAAHARMQICDWNGLTESLKAVMADVDAGRLACPPFALLAMPSSAAQQHKNAALYFKSKTAAKIPTRNWTRPQTVKIRIGYFSADFHNHALTHLAAGVFESHDKSQFEIIGFLLAQRPADDAQQRIKNALDRFMDVSGIAEEDVAAFCHEMQLDIAVDLMGHTSDSRPGLFARRLAPVQVNYLGYPGTVGAGCVDYIIADPVVIPAEDGPHYSECIARLPHSYQPNDSRRPIADRKFARAELGLPENGFIFCCFNNPYKILPDVFDIWMRLLQANTGSVLWLVETNAAATNNLKAEAEKRGVAAHRLVFAPRMTQADHLARHRVADLFLDTFPYGAHTTASDALWAGLPVLTKRGTTFASRVGESLLIAVGLPELIAPSAAAYEQTAMDLAAHPGKLKALRQKLRVNIPTSPLFDTARYTRNLERAYKRMVEIQRATGAAEDFQVTE